MIENEAEIRPASGLSTGALAPLYGWYRWTYRFCRTKPLGAIGGFITVVLRHALKNAILPVITVSGYQFARALGGVIIVETIFVVPGLGRFVIESILHRDFVVLQAVILLTAAVVLFLNLVIDMLYGVLDPRIRYQ